MRNFLKSIIDLFNFLKIKSDERKIVFYAENENSYLVFAGIIEFLTKQLNQVIYYVSSSLNDPILKNKNPKIRSFFLGSGTIRTIFFQLFNSQIMILTMPEINISYIKKSHFAKNFIYLTHNICSIHMVFRKKAFNHFDTFFCVGPHHNAEIEETEKIYKLKKIVKFNFGYNKIDQLIINKNKLIKTKKNHDKTLLIAPSWGENCILEKIGEQLLSILVNKHWKIIIRPHPDTLRLYKKKYNKLKEKFVHHPDCKFEENISNMSSYYLSDLMISDWSGTAFEFALGLEKPVIFIDLPKKINNSDFHLYQTEPIEIKLREKIGEIVKVEELEILINVLNKVYENKKIYKQKIIKAREKIIYNLGKSASKGANYIYSLTRTN